MLSAAVEPAGSPSLSAWEVWLVNKAKEERLKWERKSEEARNYEKLLRSLYNYRSPYFPLLFILLCIFPSYFHHILHSKKCFFKITSCLSSTFYVL